MTGRMEPPLLVRPLTDDERAALGAGPRSPDAFAPRRCQVLPAGAEGLRPAPIAARLACASQPARDAIRACHAEGPGRPREKSRRPHTTGPEIDDAGCQRLRALLHRSPRDLAEPTSTWTLALAAEVACAEGITARLVSDETIRRAIGRLGCGWRRAKARIAGPDPAYPRKERRGAG